MHWIKRFIINITISIRKMNKDEIIEQFRIEFLFQKRVCYFFMLQQQWRNVVLWPFSCRQYTLFILWTFSKEHIFQQQWHIVFYDPSAVCSTWLSFYDPSVKKSAWSEGGILTDKMNRLSFKKLRNVIQMAQLLTCI
jgi:hypothetical protein